MGTLCSIAIVTVFIIYTTLKLDVLINKKEIDILSVILDTELTQDDVFSYQNGLNVAVAFTAFDDESENILDPTYGELVMNHY